MLKDYKKLPMSKKLTIVITWGFFIAFAFTMFSYIYWDKDVTFIFQYMFYVFNVTISAYFLKSGAENVTTIKITETFKDKQGENNQG